MRVAYWNFSLVWVSMIVTDSTALAFALDLALVSQQQREEEEE